MNDGQPSLRLYDVTDTPSPDGRTVAEVVLPPFTANWYLRGLRAARTYAAELGWRESRGVLVSLLRSNAAATPADRPTATTARSKIVGDPVPREPEPALTPGFDLPSSYTE